MAEVLSPSLHSHPHSSHSLRSATLYSHFHCHCHLASSQKITNSAHLHHSVNLSFSLHPPRHYPPQHGPCPTSYFLHWHNLPHHGLTSCILLADHINSRRRNRFNFNNEIVSCHDSTALRLNSHPSSLAEAIFIGSTTLLQTLQLICATGWLLLYVRREHLLISNLTNRSSAAYQTVVHAGFRRCGQSVAQDQPQSNTCCRRSTHILQHMS